MTNPIARGPTATQLNSPEQLNRRKITRDTSAIYFAICRAAGLEPEEAQTCFAISSLLYDRPGQDAATPRKLTLAAIGAAMTSQADDEKDKDARWKRAQRNVTHLFCHALPRIGLQLLGRDKAAKDSGESHKYADHAMIVAGVVAELFDEKRKAILSTKGLNPKEMADAISRARERLAAESLVLFEPLDTAIVGPDRKLFAVVTAPEAKAFCEKNPTYKASAYAYTEPKPDEKRRARPFCREDLEKMIDWDLTRAEKRFEEIAARNTIEEARRYVADWLSAAKKRAASWVKVSDAITREEEVGELIHAPESGGGEDADGLWKSDIQSEGAPQDILSWGEGVNSFADNADENESLEIDPVENPPEAAPILTSSENFDSALEAALFYVRDGWAIVPCCQFDPVTGRCTGPESHHKDGVCKGKTPLIKGKKPTPGAGYTAASRDKGLIRDWFTRQFLDAGVAIRLDGHILLDCDVKDGGVGIESYETLANTFDLPATLTAITPSGGRHYIFKLPEGLPDDFLGSWTRVLDYVDLRDIDIKVGNRGLAHVEPTMGKAGRYRWLDPTSEIAELPRACCDYLHGVHEREQQAKLEKAQASRTSGGASASMFDPGEDQSKYFKDVPAGQRRPRLRQIACKLAASGADVNQIVSALNYHNEHFTEPVNDPGYIARVANGAVLKFAPSV